MGRHAGVDMPQEGEELLVPVAPLALGEHFSGGDVQGGEQGRGAVADVVVGHPLDVAEPHGQHWLGALERLDLGLFVDAQDYGVIGRVQVQPDDVAHFLDRIVGEFEVALAMRLDAEQVEPALHGALGDAGVLGHGAHAPLRGVGRLDPRAVLITSATRSSSWVRNSSCSQSFTVSASPLADGDVARPMRLAIRLTRLRRRPGSGPRTMPETGEAEQLVDQDDVARPPAPRIPVAPR